MSPPELAPTDPGGGGDAGFTPAGDAASLRARSIAGAGITFLAQAGKFVLQFGGQVALARLLLPHEFGLVAMVTPLIAFAMLLTDLGLSQAIVQRAQISHDELSSMFWLNVGIGLLLAALAALGAPLLANAYRQPLLVPIVIALAGALFLLSIAAQPMAILNRRLQFGRIATVELAALLASVVAGIAGALLGWGVWALVAMQLVNGVATMALALVLAGFRPARPHIGRSTFELVRFGGHLTGYNLLGYLITNLDNILIGARFGPVSLGLYDRAYKLIFQPLWQMTTPAARVAVPLLSRLDRDAAAYRATYLAMLGLSVGATTPGLLAAAAFATPIMTWLLGPRWSPAAPIFAWLALCALAMQLRQAGSWLFVSQGRVGEQLLWGGAGSLATIASYFVGIAWGPQGVAIAATLSTAFVQIPLLWWPATRRGPVRHRDAARLLAPLAAAAIGTALALAALRRLPIGTGLPAILAGLVTAYLAFAILLLPTRTGRDLLGQLGRIRGLVARR